MPDEVNIGFERVYKETYPEFVFDKRSTTSAENGRNGGKPHTEVDEIAREFVEYRHSENGYITLRYYAGGWYEYKNGWYVELKNGDLVVELLGALQRAEFGKALRLSKTLLSDIIENMKSDAICGLHSRKYQIPCWISSKESAKGVMPMRNAVVDINALAQAVIDGTPLQQIKHREKTPDLFVTYGLDYDFDPNAKCPKFLRYLEEVQPKQENRDMLQMLMGLALVPDCSYNVAFFLVGQGGTGKTVFVKVLSHLVGKDNHCCVPLATFASRFGKSPLTKKLLNIVGELPVMAENGRSADIEGFFKSVTSGDDIPVENKNVDGWNAPAIARCVFATNTMPAFTDRSNGVWDRIRIIPFEKVFRNTDKQNPNLAAELIEEIPGILNFAIEGLAMLRKLRTFPDCLDGMKMREELRTDCDHERTFLQEKTQEAQNGYIPTTRLYDSYKSWMSENGYRAVGMSNFQKAVRRIYPTSFIERRNTDNGKISVFSNISFQF